MQLSEIDSTEKHTLLWEETPAGYLDSRGSE
jgi:hypothetical protein